MIFVRLDLHTHSTASDGEWPPDEVVRRAFAQGVKLLALTDHDAVDGIPAAQAEGKRLGVLIVPGVELSADHPGELHILGYGIHYDSPLWSRFLEGQQQRRLTRNQALIQKLAQLGMPLDGTELELSRSRTHIAQAMVQKGYALSIREVFTRWLDYGKPCYMPGARPPSGECIRLIRETGGDAVLAHPGLMDETGPEREQLWARLRDEGLAGVEAFYPRHSHEQALEFVALAQRLGLFTTYGSDTHGALKPNVRFMKDIERFPLPESLWARARGWAKA